jgi:hypothetical protein
MEIARPIPKKGLAAKTAVGDEREGLSLALEKPGSTKVCFDRRHFEIEN